MRNPGSPPNTSRRQAKFLKNGLKALRCRSYFEYLNSDLWRSTRQRYRKSGLPQKCVVCHAINVDLHHKTYRRLGAERLTDLVPLCRMHHDALHDAKLDLWSGAAVLRSLELARRSRGNGAAVGVTA